MLVYGAADVPPHVPEDVPEVSVEHVDVLRHVRLMFLLPNLMR